MNIEISRGQRAQRQASNTAGDSRLNSWLFYVLTDRRLSGKAIAAAFCLRDCYDQQHRFASESIRSMAKATGLSKSALERAVRKLVALGYIECIAGGGPRNSNIYRLIGR